MFFKAQAYCLGFFNRNAHSYVHRPEEHSQFAHRIQLLREMGEPAAMQGKEKSYAADHLLQPKPMLPHNWLHAVVPETLKHGKQVDVSVMVGEDFTKSPAPRTISLSVTYSNLAEASHVDIMLNKHPLSGLNRRLGSGTDGNSERAHIVALHQEISLERPIQGHQAHRHLLPLCLMADEITVHRFAICSFNHLIPVLRFGILEPVNPDMISPVERNYIF